MAKRYKPLIEFRCNKCKKLQPKNEEKSNKNWQVFDCNVSCECGGKFVMFLDGEPVSKDA
jgi:hypothetical protein